jgi:hypothetical protein
MARFGNPVTQYLDDAGNPLINGKLYFYESGTTTLKDTYSDVNLSIANPNPVLLSGSGRMPNVFFNGTARVVLTKNDDTQIWDRDPVGGEAEEGVFSPWNLLTVYNVPDIVVGSDGNFYISITNGNQNNDPTTSPSNWTQFRLVRVWNTNETYEANQIVEGSDGLLYTSTVGGNVGNDPTSDSVNWKPSATANIEEIVNAAVSTYSYNNF